MENTISKRKKPSFLRRDYHKKIKLGKGVKKKQKWRAAKGRHNKIRLGRKSYPKRPKIGFGENKRIKSSINGLDYKRVENISCLNSLKSGDNIMIASVGLKKRKEIISKAKEIGLNILNRYKKVEDKKWTCQIKRN